VLRSVKTAKSGLLRAGVIGTGAFGRHHAGKYARVPGVALSAIADPNPETRRTVAAAYGTAAVADWRELLGRVDIVSVCSPATTHAEIVGEFLNSGTHVLVEKPIATTLEEADDLIALADARGLVLTVGHQERFVFARTGLLDFADAPLEVSCWRAGPWSGRGADVSVVLDLMIHDLDLVHRIIPGAVVDVEAFGRAVHGPLADEVSATVTFENGSEAKLHASRVAQTRRRGMRAVYRDGTIEFDFITRAIRNTTRRPLQTLNFDDPLGESVAAFVQAVRAGETAVVRPEEARLALETALMIDGASRRPQWRRSAAQVSALA
jgi:predicted dehydrogenase